VAHCKKILVACCKETWEAGFKKI